MSINKDLKKCLSTYKVFLKLLHLLLVALQSAVVHGSALDGDLPHLQVHLLQLKPAVNTVYLTTISNTLKYLKADMFRFYSTPNYNIMLTNQHGEMYTFNHNPFQKQA